jgi:nucleoside 2-deoxyribosyltransferase
MKVYLAGPMSGHKQQNFPAFQEAAKMLRAQNFDVVSPAEMDDPKDYAIAMADEPAQKTWGEFLARDIKMIADGGIDGIVFLPDWFRSRGARLEATVGLLQKGDFAFFQYNAGQVKSLRRGFVAYTIYEETMAHAS